MAGFQGLSGELVLLVADHLGDKDLSHLALGNYFLHEILSRSLLKRALEEQTIAVQIHALTWAISYGHTNLVRTIVSQPDFSTSEDGIEGALNEAAALGHCDIISILVGADYDVNSSEAGSLPLHVGAMNGRATVVKRLIDLGADINATDKDLRTAFTLAIKSQREIFRKLQKGLPKPLSHRDEAQLIHTVESSVVETLRVLVENGAHHEISVADRFGDTPLHDAIYFGLSSAHDVSAGTGVLQFLVDQGASLSVCNNSHYRPIDLTVLSDTANRAALNFFLDLGVSPDSTDSCGRSLLSNSLISPLLTLPVLELLLKRGASTADISLLYFFEDAWEPDQELFNTLIRLLLDHGASFGENGGRCFTLAAVLGSLDMMEIVFSAGGIDINKSFPCLRKPGTPLQIALAENRITMVRFLVDKGVAMSDSQEVEVAEMLGRP